MGVFVIMSIVLAVLAGWVLVAVLLALLIGRAVRIADRRQRAMLATRPAPRPAPVSARKVPVRA